MRGRFTRVTTDGLRAKYRSESETANEIAELCWVRPCLRFKTA